MIPESILLFILAAVLIGFGWLGAWLFLLPRLRRIRRQEWKAASIYYERKFNPDTRRI